MSQPIEAIEYQNRSRNILSFTGNDGSSLSVGGKERIIIPTSQAGHETIVRAVGRGDLLMIRTLWLLEGQEVPEPKTVPEKTPERGTPAPASESEESDLA